MSRGKPVEAEPVGMQIPPAPVDLGQYGLTSAEAELVLGRGGPVDVEVERVYAERCGPSASWPRGQVGEAQAPAPVEAEAEPEVEGDELVESPSGVDVTFATEEDFS